MTHGVSIDVTPPTGPSAETAQSLQTAIDCCWPLIRGDHVPAIGHQGLLREHTKHEWAVMSRTVPAEEVAQVVAVAARGGGRQAIARQAGEERVHPVCLDHWVGLPCLYWARSHTPR